MSRAVHDINRARLLTASALHSGDWLHPQPIASVGLRLSDEATRVAVAHRLGCKACECPCDKAADERGLHGLAAAAVRRGIRDTVISETLSGEQ